MKWFRISAIIFLALFLVGAKPGGPATWQVPGDFATIQDAVDDPSVQDGDTIRVGPGSFAGALLDKSLTIKGVGRTVIDDGPAHGSGLIFGFRLNAGSDGTTLSHLIFLTDLSIMNGAAVDDVTVTQCAFYNSVQAISNWRGSRWEISHNRIQDLRTLCGGGIGILVADFSGGNVHDNVISHNTIQGVLHVDPDDCGGYSGSGIVLYADFRWVRQGTADMAWNRVVKNKVAMSSDTPDVVDVVAFELTDTRDDPTAAGFPVIHDNAIGFNDFRGTGVQIVLTPLELEDHNALSRNLGMNRGHGLHPSLFGPGGN